MDAEELMRMHNEEVDLVADILKEAVDRFCDTEVMTACEMVGLLEATKMEVLMTMAEDDA